MQSVVSRIATNDWRFITQSMHDKGYAIFRNLLTKEQCYELKSQYDKPNLYRKTVTMERYRFGQGEYKYFNYPLPPLIQSIREEIYPHLSPIANDWMRVLNMNEKFPGLLSDLLARCQAKNQVKPTPLILKYREAGHNTLHQDLYGDIWFPIQMVLFLSEMDEDYTGGEFVLTQQTPRAQSKAIVLKPRKGDALIFTTNFRPVKGAKGYYRVNMKHGVSEVHTGERFTLGIIFHDAVS